MGKAVFIAILLTGLLIGCAPVREELLETGKAQYQAEQFDQAKATFNRTLYYYPGEAEAFYAMGRICHTEGNLPQAIFYYRSCLDVAPGHTHARAWLERAVVEASREPEPFHFNY